MLAPTFLLNAFYNYSSIDSLKGPGFPVLSFALLQIIRILHRLFFWVLDQARVAAEGIRDDFLFLSHNFHPGLAFHGKLKR